MAGVGASAEGLTPTVRGWQEPLGTSPTAPLPPGLSGHADLVFPGEQSSSRAPRASRWRNAPSLSMLEVTVLVPSLAAPGLPYLQSLQSLGALGTWWAAGGALVGKKKHRLRWERTQRLRRSRAGKDGLCSDAGDPPLTAWFWLRTPGLAEDPAPPHSVSPQLPNDTGGDISGQGSARSSSCRYPAKTRRREKGMAALTKKSALPSTPWMCPGGPWREGDHQHPRLNLSTPLQEG